MKTMTKYYFVTYILSFLITGGTETKHFVENL